MGKVPFGVIVASHKGGVGKTTISVNIAVALKLLGYNVLLLDTDFTDPNIGVHLGLEDTDAGLLALAAGKITASRAISVHAPTGLHVLSCELEGSVAIPKLVYAVRLFNILLRSRYDFIVVDTPPGSFPISIFNKFTRLGKMMALIITTPDTTASTAAIKTAMMFDNANVAHELVINMDRKRRYSISPKEIREAYGKKAIAMLPFDESIPMSIGERIPAVLLKPRSGFSRGIIALAKIVAERARAIADKDSKTGD